MLCRESYLKNDYSYFPSDVVPVLATASASLRRILGEDVQDDKASPASTLQLQRSTATHITHAYSAVLTTHRYTYLHLKGAAWAAMSYAGHGLPPLRRQWGLWDPERHRTSKPGRRGGLPCRTPHHGLPPLFGGNVTDTTLDTMALPAVRAYLDSYWPLGSRPDDVHRRDSRRMGEGYPGIRSGRDVPGWDICVSPGDTS